MTTLKLTPSGFFKAWISALVVLGERAIATDHPATRHGLKAVRNLLEQQIRESEGSGDLKNEYAFLDLRNQFLPSNTGSYDGVERALRNLQTSLVMSPNPEYEEMVLEIPLSFAQSIVEDLPEKERLLVQKAASAYLDDKKAFMISGRTPGEYHELVSDTRARPQMV